MLAGQAASVPAGQHCLSGGRPFCLVPTPPRAAAPLLLLLVQAVIDGSVLCVHGGLSPDVRTLDQVRMIDRVCEIPHEGPFCDLMWSDPEEIESWAVSPRGAGGRPQRLCAWLSGEARDTCGHWLMQRCHAPA